MTVSMNISLTELNKLRDKILSTGLKRTEVTNEYELLRVQDGQVMIIVYKSGKLVHNDTEATRKIIDSILERERDYAFLLGTDEVGKGEWYGPLIVTCAALVPTDIVRLRKIGVKDSKLLNKDALRKLAYEIRASKILYRNLSLMPETYNSRYAEFEREGKTLNDLLAWCHATIIRSTLAYLPHTAKTRVVIDKFDFRKTDLRIESAKIRDENVEVIQSSRGDNEIPISVASIIAKDLFEERVDSLSQNFKIDLRSSAPSDVDPGMLPKVAKLHFSNVRRVLIK